MGKENKQMSKLTLVALILMIFTSVFGFNNIPIAQYKNPPLASVDINSEKLGMYATKLLIDKLESRESKGYYVVETNLIERESLVKKR
mgnify:CR=1 FL=1